MDRPLGKSVTPPTTPLLSREAAASSISRSRFALHDTFAGYRARFRPRPSVKCAAICRKWDLSGTTGPGRGLPEKTETPACAGLSVSSGGPICPSVRHPDSAAVRPCRLDSSAATARGNRSGPLTPVVRCHWSSHCCDLARAEKHRPRPCPVPVCQPVSRCFGVWIWTGGRRPSSPVS